MTTPQRLSMIRHAMAVHRATGSMASKELAIELAEELTPRQFDRLMFGDTETVSMGYPYNRPDEILA